MSVIRPGLILTPMVMPWPAGRLAWVNSPTPSATSSDVHGLLLCTGPAKQLSSCAPPGTVALTDTSLIGAFQSEPVASQ